MLFIFLIHIHTHIHTHSIASLFIGYERGIANGGDAMQQNGNDFSDK